MQTDATAFIAPTQRHPEEARRQFAEDLLHEISRSQPASASARREWPRLGEALASAWISFICSWHSVRAGHAPSRC